jgi:hypothetical protein
MQKAWTGNWPEHQAPQIQSLRLNEQEATTSVEGSVGQVFRAEIDAAENHDHLISWRVREEVPAALQSDGGDFEPTPPTIESLLETQSKRFEFTVSQPGEYRLFCQIDTPHHCAAVTNIPFLITSKPRKLARLLNLFGKKAA